MTTPNSAPGAIVLPDILTPAQQSTLLASAIEYRRSGVLEANPSGPNRYRARLFNSKHCTPLMLQLGHEIALLLGVEEYPIDPYHGTAVLEGEAPRVVMQYGFSVPRNYQLPALPARIS